MNAQHYVAGPSPALAPSNSGSFSGFDTWFARGVRDTGLPFGPSLAVCTVLGISVLVAVAVYVVWENELASVTAAALASLLCIGVGAWRARRRRLQAQAQL